MYTFSVSRSLPVPTTNWLAWSCSSLDRRLRIGTTEAQTKQIINYILHQGLCPGVSSWNIVETINGVWIEDLSPYSGTKLHEAA